MRLYSVNHWTLGSAFTAVLFSLPILIIGGFVFAPEDDIWRHLAATVLPDYVANSVVLVVGVVLLIMGMNATGSVADRVSDTFTGRFTDKTTWYIIGGIALGLIGLLLALVGGQRKMI